MRAPASFVIDIPPNSNMNRCSPPLNKNSVQFPLSLSNVNEYIRVQDFNSASATHIAVENFKLARAAPNGKASIAGSEARRATVE